MASRTRARTSTAGILLLAAGVILAIYIVFPLLKLTTFSWLVAVFDLVLGVALALLGARKVGGSIGRVALYVAAVGWILLAIGGLVALPGPLGTLALWLAIIGSLASGIVSFTSGLGAVGARWFVVAMILAAAYLFGQVAPSIVTATVLLVVTVLLAVALIIAGLFVRR